MNTNRNLEEYPRLVPPEVVYEHKASLKKPFMIPLYAKITAAAAAVALLFGIFWHRNSLPERELLAELKPIKVALLEAAPLEIAVESQALFGFPHEAVKPSSKQSETLPCEKAAIPLLAELQPKVIEMLPSREFQVTLQEPISLPMENEVLAFDDFEGEEDMSFMRRGFLKMTDGQFDGLGGMLANGWRSVKVELAQFNESVSESFSSLKQETSSFMLLPSEF